MGLFSFLFSKLKKPSAVSHPPRTSPFAADPTETVPDATMMVPRFPQDEPQSNPVSAAPSDPSDELMDAIATAVMEKAAAPLDPPAAMDSQPQAWTPETDSTPVDQPTERITPAELAALMDSEPEVVPVAEPEIEEISEPEVVPLAEPVIEEIPEPEVVPVAEPVVEEIPEPEVIPVAEPVIEEIPEPEVVPVAEPVVEETPEPEVVPVAEPVIEEIPEPEVVPVAEPEIEEISEPEVVPVAEPVVEEIPEPEVVPVVDAEPVMVPDVTGPIPSIPDEQWGSSLPENFVPQTLHRSLLPQFDDEKLRLVWKLKGTGKKRRQRVICECVKDQPVFIICDSNGSNCTVITEEGEEIGRLSERDSTVYHEVVAGNPHNLYIKKIRMNDYNKPTVKILVIVRERRAAE